MYNHTHTVINAHERSYVHWFSFVFSFSFPSQERPLMFRWVVVPNLSGR